MIADYWLQGALILLACCLLVCGCRTSHQIKDKISLMETDFDKTIERVRRANNA